MAFENENVETTRSTVTSFVHPTWKRARRRESEKSGKSEKPREGPSVRDRPHAHGVIYRRRPERGDRDDPSIRARPLPADPARRTRAWPNARFAGRRLSSGAIKTFFYRLRKRRENSAEARRKQQSRRNIKRRPAVCLYLFFSSPPSSPVVCRPWRSVFSRFPCVFRPRPPLTDDTTVSSPPSTAADRLARLASRTVRRSVVVVVRLTAACRLSRLRHPV